MDDLLSQYPQLLKSQGDPDEAYKWEGINHFHWNIDADNFEKTNMERLLDIFKNFSFLKSFEST